MVPAITFLAGQSSPGLAHLEESGPGGGPPNNWLSTFGEDAWGWDEGTRQYYYRAFFREYGEKGFLVVVNLGHEHGTLTLPPRLACRAEVVVSTHPEHTGRRIAEEIPLAADEGRIAMVH